MNWIKKLIIKVIGRINTDPCRDPRCKGCSHIDGPICPYPDYCSAMRPTPTCYNCKHSYYGAGSEGCKIHGDVPLAGDSACSDHEYYD